MTIQNIFLFGRNWINDAIIIIGISQIIVAFLVLFKNLRNKINIIFFIGIIFLSFWVISTSLFRSAKEIAFANIFLQFKLFFGLTTVIVFQFFSIYFPYQKNKSKPFQFYLIILPSIIALLIIIIYPNFVINKLTLNPDGNFFVVNKFYWVLFSYCFIVNILYAFFRLFAKFQDQYGFVKTALFYVIVSILIPAIFCILFNIILFFFDVYIFDWLGAFLTLMFSFLLSYYIFISNK
jgi:hypothetical protein